MLEPEEVSAILRLNELGWGAKRIARELGIGRNTARDYIAADARLFAPPVRPGLPQRAAGELVRWLESARSPDLVGSPRIDESPFSARC